MTQTCWTAPWLVRRAVRATQNRIWRNWRRCTRSASRAPPFIDGNKRSAYVALETFLALNGLRFPVSDADAVIATLQMAAGDTDDAAFIAWVRANAVA